MSTIRTRTLQHCVALAVALFVGEGSDASVVDHEGRVSLAEAPSFLAELGKMTVGRRSPRAPQVRKGSL